MEDVELRSKDEVKRDIENNRREIREAVKETKVALVEQNPAVRAWRVTKTRALLAKDKTVYKAHKADIALRCHIYRSIGVALAAGAAVGFLLKKRRAAKARRCW